MSESDEEEATGGMSIEEVFEQFKTDVGHYPHKTEQFLAYCKNNNHPYRFKDIREFWPTRPIKEEKPPEKAINANDYRDGTEAASPEPKVANDAEAEDEKSDNDGGGDDNNNDNNNDDNDDNEDDAQPDPEPEPEAQPDPDPEPEPQPDPEPEAQPDPEPAADDDAGGDEDDDEDQDDDDGDDDDDED